MNSVKYWNLSAYRGATGDDAPQLKIQYSADGTNWHDTFTEGDLYMRTSSDDGQTWSGAMQFIQNPDDFNGTYPNLVAGDLIPKNTSPILFTHKYAAQTTGGDADIQNGDAMLDSIKGNLVNISGVLVPFLADTFVSTSMNLVNSANYLTIGGRKAYYFPVVAGAWGEYGTTEQNNGYKILATSTPYAVNFSQTKPTTSAYGTACTYHTHNSVKYYTPATNGWLVIIMPDDVVPACHLEWSGEFEDEAGTFGNTTKSIGTAVAAVHAWGLSGLVGADRSSFDLSVLDASLVAAGEERHRPFATNLDKVVIEIARLLLVVEHEDDDAVDGILEWGEEGGGGRTGKAFELNDRRLRGIHSPKFSNKCIESGLLQHQVFDFHKKDTETSLVGSPCGR